MLDIEDNLFFRMNIEEITSLLEELDTNDDKLMGLPDINSLSSWINKQKELVKRLSTFLLSASAHIEQVEKDEDKKDEILPIKSKKRCVHESGETLNRQTCITTSLS